MSGGSYNYLGENTEHWVVTDPDLRRMSERLNQLDVVSEAARDTHALLMNIIGFRAHIEQATAKLQPVWHAVEWADSGDSTETDARMVTDQYSINGMIERANRYAA